LAQRRRSGGDRIDHERLPVHSFDPYPGQKNCRQRCHCQLRVGPAEFEDARRMQEPATEVAVRSAIAPTVESDREWGRARLLAAAGIGGALIAAAFVGALHLLPGTADISPIHRTISEYALTGSGWAFNLGVIALAFGSLAVFAALVSAGHADRWSMGSLLGVLWAAALLVIVLFPKHNWAVGPSTNGQIHRVASIVAFLCLPVAVMLLTRRRSGAGSTSAQAHPVAARSAFWLAVLSLAWFSPLVGAMLLSPITQTPWYRAVPLGLIERGLVICEVLAVIALGIWALTSTRRNPAHPPANPARTAPAL